MAQTRSGLVFALVLTQYTLGHPFCTLKGSLGTVLNLTEETLIPRDRVKSVKLTSNERQMNNDNDAN